MAVPPVPPGVSLQDNIALANNRRMHLKPGSAFAYSWAVQSACNLLLIVCIGYLGIGWSISHNPPELDQVVLNYSLSNGKSVYGVRDGRGGATVGFSYRYYVHEDMSSDQEILTTLGPKHPFIKTREPDVQVTERDGVLHFSVGGRVYDYSSYSLEGLGAVNIQMKL